LLNVNYDIICLTETWLNDNVFDSELGFTNYNLYRNDRNNLSYGKKRGGGVLLSINKIISCDVLNVSSVSGIEQVFLKLILNNIKIILGCIYIPPDSSCDVYSKHCEVIESIYLMYPDYNYVITGDFNLNQFD